MENRTWIKSMQQREIERYFKSRNKNIAMTNIILTFKIFKNVSWICSMNLEN
jgi:hypothetical protein